MISNLIFQFLFKEHNSIQQSCNLMTFKIIELFELLILMHVINWREPQRYHMSKNNDSGEEKLPLKKA